MDIKKICIILAVMLLAIAAAGSVSAFSLGDIFGSDEDDINVGGIDFEVPDGYVSNNAYDQKDNITVDDSGLQTKTNTRGFTKGNDVLYIMVIEYEGLDVDDSFAGFLGGEVTTFADQQGYLNVDGIYSAFDYACDGKLVILTATDENVFEEVIS